MYSLKVPIYAGVLTALCFGAEWVKRAFEPFHYI